MPTPKYTKRVHKLLDPVNPAPRSGPDYIKVNRPPKKKSNWSTGGKGKSLRYKKVGASGVDRVVEENAAREAGKIAKKRKRKPDMMDYVRGKAKTIRAMK